MPGRGDRQADLDNGELARLIPGLRTRGFQLGDPVPVRRLPGVRELDHRLYPPRLRPGQLPVGRLQRLDQQGLLVVRERRSGHTKTLQQGYDNDP